jgi:hypothetical protein
MNGNGKSSVRLHNFHNNLRNVTVRVTKQQLNIDVSFVRTKFGAIRACV